MKYKIFYLLLLFNLGLSANNDLVKCNDSFEIFKPCYANVVSVVSVDDDGNYVEKIQMKTFVAPKYSHCAGAVKKWLADLTEQGYCLSGPTSSWGAPLSDRK